MEKNNEKIFIIILIVLFLGLTVYSNFKEEKIEYKKVKIVPPQFVYNALNNKDKNILLVNTLSDTDGMKYKITLNGNNDERSLSKKQFEDLLLKNNNMIPKDIDMVVIYCASWSCNGAKNYYKELVDKHINVEKVVDYVGSIHEWASYAKLKPSVFGFNSLENGNPLILSKVTEIFKNTAHNYYIDNVMKDEYLKQNSIDGKIMFV
jgi:hypothetical protein